MNAVALEFILEADNLIFRCFAPKRYKALVKHCRPLRSPQKLPSRRGLNLSAVGDQDCPTTCPERTASDPLCPAWQKQILVGPDYKDACPRLPAAQPFDVGDGEDAGIAVG